jgi:hypothetical protein
MIEYVPPDTEARKLEEMLQRYRNIFGTEEGRLVLGDILVMLHFGVPINSEEERIEANVGIAIARMAGVMDHVDKFVGIGERR